MPSGLTITIPVKIYIREFFENLYGSPCVFPRKHHINSAIASRLIKPPADYLPKPADPDDLQIELRYNDTVNVLYRSYLSKIAKEDIRSELRNIFYYRFHKFVNERISKGMQIKEAVWEFIRYYQLSPDAYDTLAKKMVRRLGDDAHIIPKKAVRCASQMSTDEKKGDENFQNNSVRCASQMSATPSLRRKKASNNNVRCANQKSVQLSMF